MGTLRDYQIRIAKDGAEILQRKKITCLFMEVRCGKTLTALEICKLSNANRVLFITKIKAFSSIQNDYNQFGYKFDLTIINRESLHKIETNDFDVVIIDEVHGYTSYPKPSKYAKDIKQSFGNIPMIMLSGTPTPESYSQYYHLFWLSNHSPFKEYTNFYKWANEYVNIKLRYLGYAQVKNYSDADKKKFWHMIRYYILTYTQAEANFNTEIKEIAFDVEMNDITYKIIDKLHKDLVVTSSDGKLILGDTGTKLQSKHLQLASGTVKFECGESRIIDTSKAEFIKEKFKDYKIGIFYKYKEEFQMLKSVLGNKITTDLEDFNNSDKWIALQFLQGREGISLKEADYLVALNIDFSATTYFQFRDRLTTKDRKENTLFWIFSKDKGNIKSIERMVYKSLMNKKDYTLSCFRKDFNISEKIKTIPNRLNR
jgi:hypothetical protein